ncbi:hypothetical protein [Nostoc sp. NMS4]|uniref:hypothetical protein n=1 Tax=Nostoc sp. NMS4 TaxID=2815390 RepID=UPI0025E260D0|nr:hypothetical protein [Nostoc sp. NMS4]MBN3927716.1 hypothetical protein [Nostoc sp. NMS4]
MKAENTVWVLCRSGPISDIEDERSQMFEQCKSIKTLDGVEFLSLPPLSYH